MKEQIRKLAKRLGKFSLDEISSIMEIEESKVETILNNLKEIKQNNKTFFYISKIKEPISRSSLYSMFQYHSKETIEMMIKCFCAGISSENTSKILEPQRTCIVKFYKHIRKNIYDKQNQKLLDYYFKNPKIACERTFFNKNIYFYNYKNQVFITTKKLSNKEVKKHSKEEIRQIKIIYSKLCRKLTGTALKNNIEKHISEHILRSEMGYEDLLKEIFSNIIPIY